MKMLLKSTILILIFLSTTSYGWNRHGHLLVSSIAYQMLKKDHPAELDKINAIFRSHPYAARWNTEYNGAPAIHGQITREAYFFIRAAAWPDDVRGTGEHVENWHFINYHVSLPDSIDYVTIDPVDNIFVGTEEAISAITTSTSTDRTKAKKLSWLFHLVGDVHQPLHSVALFKNGHGDAGGNARCVWSPDHGGQKLHQYWDGLSGVVPGNAAYDVLDAWSQSNNITGSNPGISASSLAGSIDMKEWAKESSLLALSNAYQFGGTAIQTTGKITVIKNGESSKVCPGAESAYQPLPQNYDRDAREIALKRILRAGYRLGNELATIF